MPKSEYCSKLYKKQMYQRYTKALSKLIGFNVRGAVPSSNYKKSLEDWGEKAERLSEPEFWREKCVEHKVKIQKYIDYIKDHQDTIEYWENIIESHKEKDENMEERIQEIRGYIEDHRDKIKYWKDHIRARRRKLLYCITKLVSVLEGLEMEGLKNF